MKDTRKTGDLEKIRQQYDEVLKNMDHMEKRILENDPVKHPSLATLEILAMKLELFWVMVEQISTDDNSSIFNNGLIQNAIEEFKEKTQRINALVLKLKASGSNLDFETK